MFGQRLKEERTRLGLTQPMLAENFGSAKRTVVDWEQEKSSPTAKQLMLMQVCGIDTQYLLTGVRTTQTLSSEEQVLVDKYRLASPETKNQILLLLLGGSAGVQGIHNSPNSSISNSFNG